MVAQRSFQTLAILVGLAVLAALPIPALAQDGPDGPEYSGSYALLIGISEYDHDYWRDLENVETYLEDMRKALISKGFNITVVADPTNSELQRALRKFLMTYGGTPSDNRLLIYFMGHGHTFRNAKNGRYVGYLVSRNDASVSSPQGEIEFKTGAVPMSVVRNFAESIQAKHTLFILDACFSGHAIVEEDSMLPPDAEYVVQVMTSGAAFQPVPATSTFTESLLRAITTARVDGDRDGFLTGSQLGDFLHRTVIAASEGRQTPYTSKLFGRSGEFVFRVPRDNP